MASATRSLREQDALRAALDALWKTWRTQPPPASGIDWHDWVCTPWLATSLPFGPQSELVSYAFLIGRGNDGFAAAPTKLVSAQRYSDARLNSESTYVPFFRSDIVASAHLPFGDSTPRIKHWTSEVREAGPALACKLMAPYSAAPADPEWELPDAVMIRGVAGTQPRVSAAYRQDLGMFLGRHPGLFEALLPAHSEWFHVVLGTARHAQARRLALVVDGRAIPIDDGSTTIGRFEGNGIVLTHTSVSRRHAVIVGAGPDFVLRDTASSQGIFHNGQRVKEAPIREGDSYRLGGVELRFEWRPRSPGAANG